MSFFKNTVSLLALFSVIPAANAVTARPSMLSTTSGVVGVSASGNARRMPTMTSYITGNTGTSSGGVTNTPSNVLLSDIECIDAYTECIRAEDTCGENFEECTNRVLFHAKMPLCISTLSQCSASGVNSLFGTSAIGSLSNVASTNTYGEVTDYTYPTDGSVMGQMVIAAGIENKYDTSTCVKRYTSCLKKDSVCGADFELCTSTKEFRKQALLCDSTLARCQSDGVKELLGSYPWSPSSGTVGGRIATEIENGAQLAAMNAVSTCYKVVEQCFLGACTANPFRCIEGTSLDKLIAANLIVDPESGANANQTSGGDTQTLSDVNRYLRTSCLDTIGGNKYCHMTFREKTPSKGELVDVDVQEEVFDEAIDQRKKYVDSKIQDVMQKFDTRAKDKCIETIKSCAMRTCGEGVGSVCYTSAFSADGQNTVNGASTYGDIKIGCESVVNTDANCQYAYKTIKDEAYSYAYLNDSVFDTLFPPYDETTKNDPLGVVATLNSTLSTAYNAAAIAEMRKQCQSVATSCVKSLCGTDYENCYRNRTDVYSSLTNTGEGGSSFDRSMNKVGGVLDYTIVLGLCMNTVKNADVCDEHLKIEQARLKRGDQNMTNSWGDQSTVRGGWIDAGGAKNVSAETEEPVHATDANGNKLCTNSKGMEGICYEVDENGDVYQTPVMESYTNYISTQAANTLFRDLIYDIEIEAQAKYNAKLTRQQNLCLSSNNGGIVGNRDNGSTFMWVRLNSNRVPASYSTAGLKSNQFKASNELYGSFCRVRVTLQSDDKYIQDELASGADWSTAYFAAGDAFTCGSWIPNDKLEKIANAAGADARADKEASQPKIKGWMAALGAVGGGVGGGFLGKNIASKGLGGLLDKGEVEDYETLQKQCTKYMDSAITATRSGNTWNNALGYVQKAKTYADKMNATGFGIPGILYTTTTTTSNSTCSSSNYNPGHECVGSKTVAQAATEIAEELNKLREKCNDKMSTEYEDEQKEAAKKNALGTGLGAGLGAIAGGALGYAVTDSILDAQLDKAEQAAIQEFMDNVGSKIRCFIGGDEVATYGEIVSTSME